MLFKEGVNLTLQPEMSAALPLIDLAHEDAFVPRKAVVTSANDSTHMKGSRHYKGLAVDLRTKDLGPDLVRRLRLAIIKRLNGKEEARTPFQVIIELEPPHIHVEYDPA